MEGESVRFEMYSPEDEKEERQRASESKSEAKTDQQSAGSYFGGMKDYLVQKKLNFEQNVSGFFNKLDEVERKLQVKQDQIDYRIERGLPLDDMPKK